MKKIVSTLFMVLFAVTMVAQKPVITFDELTHNFDTLYEKNGRATHIFKFKNEGMLPFVITNVHPSCGCTKGEFTQSPVEPGQTGEITIHYSTAGKKEGFTKTIAVTAQSTLDETTTNVTLTIKGYVVPKKSNQSNLYPIEVGDLGFKSKTIHLGSIKKGDVRGTSLEYMNNSELIHHVELATRQAENYLLYDISLPDPKPHEVGRITFTLDTRNNKLYGPVELYAYVVLDGKRDISDPYKLTIKANIQEDFSSLSVEARQQAPIIEAPAEVDLGEIAAGKVMRGKIELKNSGFNPLELRRVYSPDEAIIIKGPSTIKNGRKGFLNLEIDTKGLSAGKYKHEVIVISNDFEHPTKKIKVSWTVK